MSMESTPSGGSESRTEQSKTRARAGKGAQGAASDSANPPKRGPGRPRKSDSPGAPARRPGRPRKSPVQARAPRGPGRPMKMEGTKPPPRGPVRKPGISLTAGRRPGRPRKSETSEASTLESRIRRGPGRPRKTESLEASLRRGPGRPRKMPVLETLTTQSFFPEDQSLAMLRALLAAAPAGAGVLSADDVLTTKEVAALVRAREKEVVEAIERGELKATRIGSKWRTTRQNVASWLNS